MCDKTLTLIQRTGGEDDDTYASVVLSNCSWHSKDKMEVRDTGRVLAARVTKIRILELPDGVTIKKGDFIVNGVLERPVTKPSDLKGLEYVTVFSVGDNRRGKLQHWAVTGE